MAEITDKLKASAKFKRKPNENKANAIKILKCEVCHLKMAVDMMILMVMKGVAFVHEMKDGKRKYSCIFAWVSAVVQLLLFIVYSLAFIDMLTLHLFCT